MTLHLWAAPVQQFVQSLPSAVPGCTVVSHHPVGPSGNVEVVYTIPASPGIAALKKITLFTAAHRQLFTLVFCGELEGFDGVNELAQHMLNSFRPFEPEPFRRRLSTGGESTGASPLSLATPVQTATPVRESVPVPPPAPVGEETPADPAAVRWRAHTHAGVGAAVRFQLPAQWVKPSQGGSSRNPTVEYVCAATERTYKSFKLVTVDLSRATVDVSDAAAEFTALFRQQVVRSGTGDVRPCCFALCPSPRVLCVCAVWLRVHGPPGFTRPSPPLRPGCWRSVAFGRRSTQIAQCQRHCSRCNPRWAVARGSWPPLSASTRFRRARSCSASWPRSQRQRRRVRSCMRVCVCGVPLPLCHLANVRQVFKSYEPLAREVFQSLTCA